MKTNYEIFKNGHKVWWVSLIIGLLSIFMGVLCFTSPVASLAAMSYLFIAIFLGMGCGNIIQSIANRHYDSQWGWDLTTGILELLMGVWLLTMPMQQIMTTMIYVFAFWLIFTSIMGIGRACVLAKVPLSGWSWMLLINILILIAGFLCLISPVIAGVDFLVFAGVAFIAYGIFRFALGLKIK